MSEEKRTCGICRALLDKTGSCPRCDQAQKELVYRMRIIEIEKPEPVEDEFEL
ncbi:hypothetical protein [Schaalia sp. JY-X169]|uniref:hypothetical protein n=1 Tax=Schaalia sp. JY-X169 TaxID=2758572 RepID=UPI0015F77BDC|nr:hypothetical protein [Schaalia sp. JY-X169]